MVRGIFKEIEGILALVIFILFLIFYLNIYKETIFANYSNEHYRKIQEIDEIFNNLKKEGYIINFRVYIPKYSKELLCDINENEIRRDFCERHPFYIPYNLDFLSKKEGVLNSTNDTLFRSDLGGFLYLNLTKFKCEDDREYILIEVERQMEENFTIFVTTPILYFWLINGENVSVTTQENLNIQYCYLSSEGVCLEENRGNAYGIVIIINNFNSEKIILNISKSNVNNAENINISGLEYKALYKIIFEPRCYLDLKFLILDNLYFNFENYNDLNCSGKMKNSKLLYNIFTKSLQDIYYNLKFIGEESLYSLKLERVGPACIQYYNDFNSNIFNVNRVLFSNTSWFIELAEYNITEDIVNAIFSIWNVSLTNTIFYFEEYFNFTKFIKPDNETAFSDKALLKNKIPLEKCRYILISFDSIYNITYFEFIHRNFPRNYIYPQVKADSYFLRPVIYYYCTNLSNENLLIHLYYSYSQPKYEFRNLNKITYIDIKDLIENENVSFYLVNSNISIGNKDNKQYSKGFYTYLKLNNSLIEDYLVIYIK